MNLDKVVEPLSGRERRLKSLSAYASILTICIVGLSSCTFDSPEEPGVMVPPTAGQDPNLPQINISIEGQTRALHLQAFGDPKNAPILVLHGGPGGDFRLLLPLKELADRYYVIMWDSRGAGLSDRVSRDELTLDSFIDEVYAIKEKVAPDRKVTLIGHSFGGNVMTQFTTRYPDMVEQLVLIEPGKIDLARDGISHGGAISFLDGQNFFWQNEVLPSKDHAIADYKAIDLLPRSGRNWTCDHSIIGDYPFWRFGTFHYYIVMKKLRKLPDNFNWAEGIDAFSGKVSVVAGSCGALSEDFQRSVNLPALPGADLTVVPGAGHISLFTKYHAKTIELLRNILE